MFDLKQSQIGSIPAASTKQKKGHLKYGWPFFIKNISYLLSFCIDFILRTHGVFLCNSSGNVFIAALAAATVL